MAYDALDVGDWSGASPRILKRVTSSLLPIMRLQAMISLLYGKLVGNKRHGNGMRVEQHGEDDYRYGGLLLARRGKM
jgi:hypothetical protein